MPTIPAQTFMGFNIPEIIFGWSDIQPSMGSMPDSKQLSAKIAQCYVPNNNPNYPVAIKIYAYSSDVQLYYGAGNLRYTYTYNGQTVYYLQNVGSCTQQNLELCGVTMNPNDFAGNITPCVAWLMVYGGYYDGYNVTYDISNCTGDSDNPSLIPVNATVTTCSFFPDSGASFNSSSAWVEGSGYEGNPIVYVWKPESGELRIGVITSDIVIHVHAYKDPYAIGGDSETGGGDGDHDDSSDPIDFPSLPSISATDTGLITLYNPSLSEIRALANYMWTNPAFDISAWKKIFADPIDAILGLSIVPVAVPDGGVRPIAVGNLTTDVNMNVAAQQYIEVRCGALTVTEFWGSYLDYEPYTKAEIYLPYCGIHQLSVDDIMNKIIEVRYHIDILSGSCCAYVKCGDSVLYQFIGQCSSSIPIASGDFSEIVNSALNAALAIGTAIATDGAGVPLATALHTAGAAGAAASAAVNVQKEKIQKSGSLSGTGGMLAIQKPYLILTRPRQAHPANQYHYTGYPSFITENLSGIGGYTEIEEIHLENVPATDSELNEIVTLLESGVIF